MVSTLRGQLDSVDRSLIRGWAQDARLPHQPVSLLVMVNGTLTGRVIANRFRQDLADAGLGDGRHGFELHIEKALSPVAVHHISVSRELDGAELDRSPWLLEPITALDSAAMKRLADLLHDDVEDDGAVLDLRLDFLLRQVDRLLEIRNVGSGGARHATVEWRKARQDAKRGEEVRTAAAVRRALVVDELMPDDQRDAGSCALLSHMASLRRLGFSVLFTPALPVVSERDRHLVTRLDAQDIETCATPYYASVEEVLRRHGADLSLVYLHRGSTAFRYARLVRHHAPQARLLLAIADLQHLRLVRQAEVERRPELLPVARQAQRREADAMASADVVITHSSTEASLIRQALPQLQVHVVPWVVRAQPVPLPFEERRGLAFLADYAHAPNLDAAWRLVREVMPLVWEHEPTMECLLAGSRMPPDLTGHDPRLVPVGHVPDLARLFGRVRLTVAPLAYGAGIKGKVLESLAAGVPCVGSPVAMEGLDLPEAVTRWTAADTHGLARSILTLHRDASLNRVVAEAGLEWARQALSEQQIDDLLREVLI